jgi:hypothetical protein
MQSPGKNLAKNKDEPLRRWFASVLTDIQFWVPFALLLGGLLLLKSIH